MAAAKHNIIVSRGEDFSFTLTVADSSSAIDVSNNTFKAEIRRGSGKPLVTSFDVTLTTPASGIVDFKLPKAKTLLLDANVNYKWDLFRTEADANTTTTRLIYGDVKVEGNITDI
jgi:hypothetical protein